MAVRRAATKPCHAGEPPAAGSRPASAFLVGPPAIGFLAEAVGLRAAVGLLVTLGPLIAALAGSTRAA